MAYQNRDIEPEKLGYVRLERVKCGKANCHCANGRKHKAYYLYYRDCINQNEDGKTRLRKQYIPKSSVKALKREIQLRKNADNLQSFMSSDNDYLVGIVWQKLRNYPRSKIIERLHTEIKRAQKALSKENVLLLDVWG